MYFYYYFVLTLCFATPNVFGYLCKEVGIYPNNDSASICDSYIVCAHNDTNNQQIVSQKFKCPAGTLFSVKNQRCVPADHIICNLSEVGDNVAKDFQCESEGVHFPTTGALSCSAFIVCVETKIGVLVGLTGMCGNCSCIFMDDTHSSKSNENNAFKCHDVGRFADIEADNCKHYNLCVRGIGDQLMKTRITCPAGTSFSVELEKCVFEHQNNCSTAVSTTTTLAPTTELPSSFVCPDVGRYPDAESLDCKNYIICSRDGDGNLVKRSAVCPQRTVFNSDTRRCVLATTYACPSEPESTSTETTKQPPTDISSTTEHLLSTEGLPEVSPSTKNPQSFICPDVGRYADPESLGCKNYFICTRDGDGNLVKRSAVCPQRTVFNSDTRRCVLVNTFDCPHEIVPNITLSTASNEPSTEDSQSTEMLPSTETTPYETTREPSTDISSTTENLLSTEGLPEVSPSTENPQLFICPDVGRYPDAESLDCKNYFICTRDGDGNLVKRSAVCPQRTVFNLDTRRCVLATIYACSPISNITTTTTTVEPSTETSPLTEDLQLTETTPTFNCPDIGRYPDRESNDCKNYIRCTQNENGQLIQSPAVCPQQTIFNAETKRCVLAMTYTCPDEFETFTTEPSTTAVTVDKPFVCTSSGRFPDENSTDCKQYFSCVLGPDGSWEQYTSTCPSRTIFNWNSKRCVLETSYECPNWSG